MVTKGQAVAADIAALLRARNPLIWCTTREEARVERYLIEAAASAGYVARTWDVAIGAAEIGMKTGRGWNSPGDTKDPGTMLDAIKGRSEQSSSDRCVWIMRDLPVWLVGPPGATPLRALRNLARSLPGVPRDRAQAIVILTPSADVPPELAGHATVVEWPLPDREEVAAILDAQVEALPSEMKEAAAPNGTRDAAIDAAVGLSGEEAAACYAKSLIQLRRIDPAAVAQEKKRVITRERVLEWYDPLPGGLDAVGGLDALKAWLTSRSLAYSPKARAYGLPAPKGALLAGVPGCLTGDTIINVNRKQRPGGYKGIRLDALFYRFNDKHEEGAALGLYNNYAKKWDLAHPTRAHSYAESKQYIGFNEIKAVVYSGVKEVWRLTTDHGATIKATPDHEFLTTRGFVSLSGLKIGDVLLAHQEGVLMDSNTTGRNLNKAIRQINNVGNHPFARRRVVNGLDYTSHPLSNLVVEAGMNSMRLEDYLWALHGDTTALKFLPEGTEVHHKDRDRDNNTRGNLEPLTKAEHARLHALEDGNNPNKYRYAPRLQKVLLVERVGQMPTYDIQMAAPDHNFVANGLVVHNCGKSLTAKAVATAWGVPLLKLDLGALKSKFVGESEGNLRKAFRVVEAIGRCVLWCDEIEKAMQGATSGSADGGVSSDALGAILSWMQERKNEAFVLATANDVESLPPELLRKGRFDEVWWVDLPTGIERLAILKASLKTFGRSEVLTDADLADVEVATDGFTGSEIAAIVPDAMFVAFADGGREITAGDLTKAAKTVTPLSKTAAEKIARLRKWADGRARPATVSENVVELKRAGGRALDI